MRRIQAGVRAYEVDVRTGTQLGLGCAPHRPHTQYTEVVGRLIGLASKACRPEVRFR